MAIRYSKNETLKKNCGKSAVFIAAKERFDKAWTVRVQTDPVNRYISLAISTNGKNAKKSLFTDWARKREGVSVNSRRGSNEIVVLITFNAFIIPTPKAKAAMKPQPFKGKLVVTLKPTKKSYKPGETVNVRATVKKVPAKRGPGRPRTKCC